MCIFGDIDAICVGFLVKVEISMLYTWVLNFWTFVIGSPDAICVGFKVKNKISLLYSWVLSLWYIISDLLPALLREHPTIAAAVNIS